MTTKMKCTVWDEWRETVRNEERRLPASLRGKVMTGAVTSLVTSLCVTWPRARTCRVTSFHPLPPRRRWVWRGGQCAAKPPFIILRPHPIHALLSHDPSPPRATPPYPLSVYNSTLSYCPALDKKVSEKLIFFLNSAKIPVNYLHPAKLH